MYREIKLCVNCKYYRELDEKCLRQKKINPVTGNESFFFAITQRESHSGCSMSANWYEPMRIMLDDFDDLDRIPFGMTKQ